MNLLRLISSDIQVYYNAIYFSDMSGKGLEEGHHCNMMLICANYLAIKRLVGQHKE